MVFWGFTVVTSALLFPVAVVIRTATAPFDPRLVLLHRFTCFWASLYSWCNPFWTVRIAGQERIPRNRACVYVCNHQSVVDIFALFRLFAHFKWVSKEENFRIPFIGWNMSLNRYIRIERGSVKGTLQMMRDAASALREGNSVMIFPEGTRSPDGILRTFKAGAFELALSTGCPVLPIAIDGTSGALPKKGFVMRGRHTIRMHILERVDPEGVDARALAERVRASIAAELEAMRRT